MNKLTNESKALIKLIHEMDNAMAEAKACINNNLYYHETIRANVFIEGDCQAAIKDNNRQIEKIEKLLQNRIVLLNKVTQSHNLIISEKYESVKQETFKRR